MQNPIQNTAASVDVWKPTTLQLIILSSMIGKNHSTPMAWSPEIEAKIEIFLETVYVLSERGETRKALDFVFSHIHSLITKDLSAYSECDTLLMKIDVRKLNSTLMIGFLSITLPVKNRLLQRPWFFARVKNALTLDRGVEKAIRLLAKYQ